MADKEPSKEAATDPQSASSLAGPMAAKKEEGATEKKAEGGGGGKANMGMILAIVGLLVGMVLMGGLGFSMAYFILPDRIASALDAKTGSHGSEADEQAGEESGGHKQEAKKSEQGSKESKKEEAHKTEKTEKPKEEKKEAHGGKEAGKEGAHGEGGKEGGEEGAHGEAKNQPKDFILSEVYVNILGTRGARMLKVSLYFDAEKEVLVKLEEKRPKIIDIVSQILASKTIEQLTAEDSRGVLRKELLEKLNASLDVGDIQNIYFLDFIVQ